MKVITFRITEEQGKKLKILREKGINISVLLRLNLDKIIKQYLGGK